MRCLAIAFFCCLALPEAYAQPVADTLFTWQGYGRSSTCQVRIFAVPTNDDRPHTIVIREVAENKGHSTLEDAAFLVEQVGRQFGIDPTEATFIFHWGSFSYEDARPNRRKQLFMRATFRRTKTQRLGSPSWRVLTRAEVDDYTDRQFD